MRHVSQELKLLSLILGSRASKASRQNSLPYVKTRDQYLRLGIKFIPQFSDTASYQSTSTPIIQIHGISPAVSP